MKTKVDLYGPGRIQQEKEKVFQAEGITHPKCQGRIPGLGWPVSWSTEGKPQDIEESQGHTVVGSPCLSNGTLIQVLRDFQWGNRGDSGNPLQYSCLKMPWTKGAWQAIARGSKSWKDLAIKQYQWVNGGNRTRLASERRLVSVEGM